jgi:hypothetical protein
MFNKHSTLAYIMGQSPDTFTFQHHGVDHQVHCLQANEIQQIDQN